MTHPVSFRPHAHDTDLAGAARRTGPGLRLALHDAGCWRILEEHGGAWRERAVLAPSGSRDLVSGRALPGADLHTPGQALDAYEAMLTRPRSRVARPRNLTLFPEE